MNFTSEVDDIYFLPPASVRDLTVDYEIVNLKDICFHERKLQEDKSDKTPVSNVKIEPGTEVQDCSLLEKDSNLDSTRIDQFSQTTLVEKPLDMPLASELLNDNFQEDNDVFRNSNMSTCNNINSITTDTTSEDIFGYLTSEIPNTSEESNETIKKMKTISSNEISKEKVRNENMSNSNNKLNESKVDYSSDPLQSLAEISDPSDTTQNSSENRIKITNSDITNKNFDNNLSKNLQKEENEIDNEIVQRLVSPPVKSNTKPFDDNIKKGVNNIAKEISFIQNNNIDSSLKIFESKRAHVMSVNSSKIENVPKNCKRNLEVYSMENNSTNESINMSNICNDKDNKDNVKVDKDFVYQCLKSWRKNYPWATVEEDSWTLSCSICSHYAVETLPIYQIKTYWDIYKVAKFLRNHNILPKHRFLNYFGNFDIFLKLFETLKKISQTFPSKNVVYENIKYIVKGYNGCLIDEADFDFLIKMIAIVVREVVNKTIRLRICCGIGFICDPCRNILIVKYADSQNYPQQSVITNYVNSDSPLVAVKKNLSLSNLEKENIIFGKIFRCFSCYPKLCNLYENKENTLPPLLPHEGEFLDLMRQTNSILAFENFICSLSAVYNQNSQYFQDLNGHVILTWPTWEGSGLISFIFENYLHLKLIINTRFQFSTNPVVSYCKSFVLDTNPPFSALINAISCVANYLRRNKWKENIRKDLENKMEKFFKIMKEDKVFYSTYKETINILSLYCNEIFNENYYNGKENTLDFLFLLEPRRMANLLSHNYEANYDKAALGKIWFLLHKFIPLPLETFITMHLTHFGNHLLKICTKSKYYFHEIIGLFNYRPELRRDYPYILKFYIVLQALPFIKTRSSSSLAFIWILRCYLQKNFNSDISNSLLTILTEASTETIYDINVLHKMVINKILEL